MAGAGAVNAATSETTIIAAPAVILAAGGLTRLYARNSASANMGGDAYALALRAGAELVDMEFVQFFPIGHLAPRLVGMDPIMWDPFRYKLGGRLLNGLHEEFIERYGGSDGGSYTTARDQATYAILQEVRAGRGSPHGGVYLDFRHVGETRLREAFGPVIDRLLSNGIDLREMPMEVSPIAHYHMGGLRVDTTLQTRVEGLFAAGEAVGGANGANRLSGNALTEAFVFSERAGRLAAQRALDVGAPTMSDVGRAPPPARRTCYHPLACTSRRPVLDYLRRRAAGRGRADASPRSPSDQEGDIVPELDSATPSSPYGPRAPNITTRDLAHQFWLDVNGKEVQSASTYSYTWIADQAGHVGLGMLLYLLLALIILPWLGVPAPWDHIAALVLGTISVSYWEYRAYSKALTTSTGLFPPGRALLRGNAVIAAAYMTIGVVTGAVFLQTAVWRVVGFLVLPMLAIVLALPWLRQKVTWQKAALPYLFRLADAPPTIGAEDAKELQVLIDGAAPPAAAPRQVIVGGRIGSGRTKIAAGIGTELAFTKKTVRYVSLGTLLEFAALSRSPHFADDAGPVNINYWRWSEAQVIIIDDIGPVIATASPADFRILLDNGLKNASAVLAACHTVWVMGDLRPDLQTTMVGDGLDAFARVIGNCCSGKDGALVIELEEAQKPTDISGAKTKSEAGARRVTIRKVTL